MHVHPELRALRSDDAPQRHAQARMTAAAEHWRKEAMERGPIGEIGAFAMGRPLGECPALAALFCGADRVARDFAEGFVRGQLDALAGSHLGHLAFRHFTDGSISTLLLARVGNATLSLVAIDGEGLAEKPVPPTVCFTPSEMWERVLAGSGEADLVDAVPGAGEPLPARSVGLAAGSVLARDASRQAIVLRQVEGRLVSLRLQRRRMQAGATLEVDRTTGRVVHQAAGNPRDSRIELMVSLLGRMRRSDAAPMIARLATGEGCASLRWQAIRECLALDTRAGFEALCAVAVSAEDPLMEPAGALRAQLIETWPQLAGVAPCPEHST